MNFLKFKTMKKYFKAEKNGNTYWGFAIYSLVGKYNELDASNNSYIVLFKIIIQTNIFSNIKNNF